MLKTSLNPVSALSADVMTHARQRTDAGLIGGSLIQIPTLAEALSDCEKTRNLRGLRLERLPVPHSAGRAIQGPPAPSPSAQAEPPGGTPGKRGVKKVGLHDRAAPFLLRSRAEWTRIPIPERRGFLPVSIVAGPWIHRSRFPLV
jgi:hypothetical protein